MTALDQYGGKLQLSRVFSDTLSVIARRPVALFVPTILMSAPNLFFQLLGRPAEVGAGFSQFKQLTPIVAVLSLVMFVLSGAVITWQIYVTVSELDGQTPDLGRGLALARRRMLPMLGLLILLGLGVILGSVLLLVPGIILGLMWSVAVPAMVAEPIGVLAAFGRSRALTRNNRWRMLGLLVLVWIVLLVVEGLLFALSGGAATLASAATAAQGPHVLMSLGQAAVGLVYTVILYAGIAAVYVQLRDLKTGGAAAAAQVFE